MIDVMFVDEHFMSTFDLTPDYRQIRHRGLDAQEVDKLRWRLEAEIQKLIDAEIERQEVEIEIKNRQDAEMQAVFERGDE